MEILFALHVTVAILMAICSATWFVFAAVALRDARKAGSSPYLIDSFRDEARGAVRYLLFSPIWPITGVIGLFNLVREVYKG